VKDPGAVEHDEGLPPAAGTDLMIGDQHVTRQGSPVGGAAGQLPILHDWTQASQHPREPLRLAAAVLPAVHRGAGQGNPGEGHVEEGEALVSQGHLLTVSPHGASPARRAMRHALAAPAQDDVVAAW
jgi:hypothetical protein